MIRMPFGLFIKGATILPLWKPGVVRYFKSRLSSQWCKKHTTWKFTHRCMLLSAIAVKVSKSKVPVTEPCSLPLSTILQDSVHASKLLMNMQMAIVKGIVFFIRLTQYLILLIPVLMTLPALYLGETPRSMWYSLALKVTEKCGAAALKLGQWASTRPDLFSPEFCNTFSKLQRHAPPHDFSYTKYKLSQYFDKHWRRIIKHIRREPLGSGCVAQVYKAYIDLNNIDDLIADNIREEYISDNDDINWLDAFEVLGFHREVSTDDETSEYPSYESSSEPQIADDNLIPIAIKVLHPGVRQNITSDLSVINYLAWLGETLIPPLKYLNIVECAKEFSVSMRQQIDLRLEADNYITFAELFSDDPDIRFPRPIKPYVWRDLIVQSLEEGIPISHFLPGHRSAETYIESQTGNLTKDAQGQPIIEVSQLETGQSQDINDITQDSQIRERLADMGLNALFKMIFEYNFVHADLHPGNISVQVAGPVNQDQKVELVDLFDSVMVTVTPRENPLTLVLYDCGIITSLPSVKQKSITDVFTAIVLGDGRRVGELFIEHSTISKKTDKSAFVDDMSNLIQNYTSNKLNLKNIKVGELFGDFFSILSRHRVKLDSNFVNIMIAVVVVEGLGRSLNPDLDILQTLKHYLISG